MIYRYLFHTSFLQGIINAIISQKTALMKPLSSLLIFLHFFSIVQVNLVHASEKLRCESLDFKPKYCGKNISNAWVINQLSTSPCRLDSTFGVSNGQLWVSNGCRADFGYNTVQTSRLSISRKGRGAGVVKSDPPGILCKTGESICTNFFPQGSQVNLTATPYYDSIFSGWSGDCKTNPCLVIVDKSMEIDATFSKKADIGPILSKLLLTPSFQPPFLRKGPGGNGGTISLSTKKAKTGIVTSKPDGTIILSNNELGADVKLVINDQNGTPLPGVQVQWRALDDNLDLYLIDPSGKYAPVFYQGNPIADAYRGVNPNISITQNRSVSVLTVIVVGMALASIAITVDDYATTLEEINDFHSSNLAATYENVGVFQCTIEELLDYLQLNYHGKSCALNLIFSLGGFGISNQLISVGFTVANDISFDLFEEGWGELYQRKYHKSLLEGFGEPVTKDTKVLVQIKDFQEAGQLLKDLVVSLFPLNYDDYLEENDSRSSAQALSFKNTMGLVVKKNDPDYYTFNLNQGDSWSSIVEFLGDKGDINLKLYDPSGSPVPIRTSSRTGEWETISLNNAPYFGKYTLAVTNDGGDWDSMMYKLYASSLSGQSSSEAGNYRIVLHWGETPADLDSHLWTPQINGSQHHIRFGNKMSAAENPYVGLDVDRTDGFGPETVSISKSYPGKYHYSVHNFSGGNIAGSNAKVSVYNNFGMISELTVPTVGSGRWWDVFEIDGSTGRISVINQILTTEPRACEKMPSKE